MKKLAVLGLLLLSSCSDIELVREEVCKYKPDIEVLLKIICPSPDGGQYLSGKYADLTKEQALDTLNAILNRTAK
jgi:hypothetical protein